MPVKITNRIDLAKIINEDKKKMQSLATLTKEDKKLLGNVVLKQIRERTRGGVGVTAAGQEYKLQTKPYTREYAKEKGSRRTDVDLTLSGDMLENMYVKSTGQKTVDIAVRKRDYGKLRGAEEGIVRNRRDSNGKPIRGTRQLVKRPFFHLSKKDIETIKADPVYTKVFRRAIKRLNDN